MAAPFGRLPRSHPLVSPAGPACWPGAGARPAAGHGEAAGLRHGRWRLHRRILSRIARRNDKGVATPSFEWPGLRMARPAAWPGRYAAVRLVWEGTGGRLRTDAGRPGLRAWPRDQGAGMVKPKRRQVSAAAGPARKASSARACGLPAARRVTAKG